MNYTKIDWCDMTWNPIVGCKHNCEYCYARKIANSIYGSFEPVFYQKRLRAPTKFKKSKNIFVGSMSDIFGDWIPFKNIVDIVDACFKAPQHRYIFLTKNYKRYEEVRELIGELIEVYDGTRPKMCLGATATNNKQLKEAYASKADWISIEPIHGKLDTKKLFSCKGNSKNNTNLSPRWYWVVVGAETGNRKEKIVPKKEWIQEVAEVCLQYNIPLFTKESLREMMGDEFVQEFPWGDN